MKILITKNQYRTLLRTLIIADWIANGYSEEDDDCDKEMQELRDYIFSFYKEFGADGLLEKNPSDGAIFESREFEDECLSEVEKYDEHTFWEELVTKFSARDFLEKYGEEKIQKMEIGERISKMEPFIKKYEDEVFKKGITRFRLP